MWIKLRYLILDLLGYPGVDAMTQQAWQVRVVGGRAAVRSRHGRYGDGAYIAEIGLWFAGVAFLALGFDIGFEHGFVCFEFLRQQSAAIGPVWEARCAVRRWSPSGRNS